MKKAQAWTVRLLCALVLLVLAWQGWYFLWIVAWKYFDPTSTSFMEHRLAQLKSRNAQAELRHRWVPYDKISIHLKRAVIAAEDARFLEHEGFDWDGIQKALEKNQRRRRVVAGGSTISQQLAKNLFLSADKTPWRKAQEAVITLMLEGVLGKRRILEIYLNVVEWGDGVFGAEAAARRYHGIPAAQLGPDQAARLAVMLPAPRRFERLRGSPYLAHRTQVILTRMSESKVP